MKTDSSIMLCPECGSARFGPTFMPDNRIESGQLWPVLFCWDCWYENRLTTIEEKELQ